MTVPFSLLPAGFLQDLVEIRNAIEQRITNATNRLPATPSYHRGTPDPHALPDEELGVWLTWDNVDRDPDETYEATMLVWRWHIYIIGRKDMDTPFGGSSSLVEGVWADIHKTFVETNTDIGLDSSIDFIPTPSAAHFEGTISGGDRRCEIVEMLLETHGSMNYQRCPP